MANEKMMPDEAWAALCDTRLWSAFDPAVTRFLNGLSPAETRHYLFISVSLPSCRTFAAVSRAFNEALFNRASFGENADALFDILTDLPEGRWIFNVYGANSIPAPLLTKLRGVLAFRREGGVGYGSGEAVFLMH